MIFFKPTSNSFSEENEVPAAHTKAADGVDVQSSQSPHKGTTQ